jgi:hypothetical protein
MTHRGCALAAPLRTSLPPLPLPRTGLYASERFGRSQESPVFFVHLNLAGTIGQPMVPPTPRLRGTAQIILRGCSESDRDLRERGSPQRSLSGWRVIPITY